MARGRRPRNFGHPTAASGDDVGATIRDIWPEGQVVFDPATIDASSGDAGGSSTDGAGGEQPRRRGRRPGSGKKALDISGLESMMFSTHMMLSMITKTPELMLNEQEAKTLASAMEKVARHYDIGGASQKTVDWVNLVTALGAVYGTRIVMYSASKKQRRDEDRKNRPTNVVPITEKPSSFTPMI